MNATFGKEMTYIQRDRIHTADVVAVVCVFSLQPIAEATQNTDKLLHRSLRDILQKRMDDRKRQCDRLASPKVQSILGATGTILLPGC
jgi:3-keto-L-gulonate-6-phosphate decarboxylase